MKRRKLDEIQKKLDEIQEMLNDWKKENNVPETNVVPAVIDNRWNQFDYDPCAACSNNPMNNPFASGFCNCVLPYMYGRCRVIY